MKGYPKVKGFLVENGIRQKYVANMLNMSISTFNNKLNGIGDFTITDVKKMCAELEIKADIFFNDYVPKKQRKKLHGSQIERRNENE
ncbi:helix-turn-helix domain-containing protein [Tissierella praeacuta]|uniref:helix-turn-helix domain-containing protein n=1 Tax=Tissierella praeacuta TaxID=43131 RepID=UPI002FD99806